MSINTTTLKHPDVILLFFHFFPSFQEWLREAKSKREQENFLQFAKAEKKGKMQQQRIKRKETLQFTEGHMYSLHLATVFSADQALIRRIKIMRLACAFNNLWHRVLLRHKRYYPTNPSSTFSARGFEHAMLIVSLDGWRG